MPLPLLSSADLVKALKRFGVVACARKQKGSHKAYERTIHGRTYPTTIPMGKREVARGTLRQILKQLNIDEDEFLDSL